MEYTRKAYPAIAVDRVIRADSVSRGEWAIPWDAMCLERISKRQGARMRRMRNVRAREIERCS